MSSSFEISIPILGRVLIVDDEVELMMALREGLTAQGYEAAGFVSGTDALNALEEQGFDILLSDLIMPDMDGIAVLKEALGKDPDLVVILMTGQGTVQTAVEAMKAGAFDYVLKPFKLQALLPVLSRAMQTRRLRLENIHLRQTVAIYELSQTVARTLDLASVLDKVADAVLQQCQADEVSIMLPMRGGNELCVAAVRGENREHILGERVPMDQGIAGWVARYQEPLTVHGPVTDPHYAPVRPRDDIHSAVSYPLLVGGKLVGVLNVSTTSRRRPFRPGEVRALSVFASTAASALEGALLLGEIRQAEEKYRNIFENALEGIFQSTPDGRFLAANSAMARLYGYESPEELLASISDISKQLYVLPHRWAEFLQQLEANGSVSGFESQARRKDGELVWISENTRVVRDRDGKVLYYEGLVTDVTARKQAEAAIQHLAYSDTLTGLSNRRHFEHCLREILQDGERAKAGVTVLLMDVDRFKEINDTLGHQNGDLVLQQVAQRLQGAAPEAVEIARMGGDEFALLLTGTVERAAQGAQTVLNAVAQVVLINDLPIEIGASIGVAHYPDHGDDSGTLLRRAEVAMYAAKQAGTGYALYAREHDHYSPERLTLMGDLRRAIEGNQLLLHYQPKVDLRTHQVLGIEALARWPHRQRGLIPPAQFVPLAEQTGMVKSLTLWAIEAALRQCQAWAGEGLSLSFSVAVNLSARNLQDVELPDAVSALLEMLDLPPSRLALEVTESFIMADPERAISVLTQLRRLGVWLSVDDFGTGYSSLAYLKRLPVNEIKIDKAFVMGLMRDKSDAAIVRAAVDLGHYLGLKVVAEGVEDQETMHGLVALGCDVAQGYFISRPLPPEELVRWLAESPYGQSEPQP